MNLTLKRTDYRKDGIFSTLGSFVTLEHAYPDIGGQWGPKIPPGDYLCVRGIHKLEHGVPFETFEVTGVPGHSGLLFHVGNWNKDSNGCILVGRSTADSTQGKMVLNSHIAFEQFMKLQQGLNEFHLSVIA